MSKNTFITGTLILVVAGFIVKIIGFIYRIYLSKIIGSEGMGLFQLIAPIYSLIILTLTSGISIAVSKMVSEQLAKKNILDIRNITKISFIMVTLEGIIVSILMYIFISDISNVILKDSRTYYSILVLVPCIPMIASLSALKGYFYAINKVTPTAISQIAEQIVKFAVVIIFAKGFKSNPLEQNCAIVTLGIALGEIANLIILASVYFFKKNVHLESDSISKPTPKLTIIKNIFNISIPVSCNRFITSIMSAMELILIPRMLVAYGIDYQRSISIYGELTGMAMPLIFFPTLVTSSLATTLVPAISEAISLKKFNSVNHKISKSIKMTSFLGFISMAIFYMLSDEIANIIYKKDSGVGSFLRLLSYSCPFIYLQQTLLGILNGIGKQAVSLKNSVIGYAIRIAFVCVLIPIFGINIYVIGLFISSLLVTVLNISTINKSTGMAIDIRSWLFRPILILFAAIFICNFLKYIFNLII